MIYPDGYDIRCGVSGNGYHSHICGTQIYHACAASISYAVLPRISYCCKAIYHFAARRHTLRIIIGFAVFFIYNYS